MSIGGIGIAGCPIAGFETRKTQQSAAGKSKGVSFVELAATKEAGKTENVSFNEMLKSKYPGAYYNVMDTSTIDSSLWGRNDYPWDKYFNNNADDSVLNWKPSGAEPDMQSPAVRAKMNAMLGKIAVVIPPELEEKMKNNTELAQKVMERVDSFLSTNSTPGENEGFLMTFDENGEINHACVVGELKFTVSSSEFARARRAREAKHAEYERLAEETALKRRLIEQETDDRYYKDSMTKKVVSIAAYEAADTSKVDAYTEYLRSKYGNVRIQSIGKDQKSLDRAGKSMSGSDVVIAPNILEQMANDPEKAAQRAGIPSFPADRIAPFGTAMIN